MTRSQQLLISHFCREITGTGIKINLNTTEWGISVKYKILYVPNDIWAEDDESDVVFHIDFIKRCPVAKEFSIVVLSILHELGHFATFDNIDINAYWKEVNTAQTPQEYINIHGEYVATEWAIQWLMDEEHRNIARQFDKMIVSAN